MELIIALIAGALIGWIASLIMKTDAEQGALMNIVVGIIGSFLGRLIFGSWLQIGTADAAGSLSIMGILWGVVGAVILLAIINMFRRNRVS